MFASPFRLSSRALTFIGAFVFAVLFGVFCAGDAHAQKEDYEEWRKNQQEQYQSYLNEQDKAFLKFLKKEWKNVDVEAQLGSPIDDKPEQIPSTGTVDPDLGPVQTEPEQAASDRQAEPDPPAPPERREPTPETAADEAADVVEAGNRPEEEEPAPAATAQRGPAGQGGGSTPGGATTSLQFFGVQTAIPYSSALAPRMGGEPGKESIRSFWKTMAKQEYTATLDAAQQKKDELGLSDWGYYVYLRDLGARFYQEKGVSSSSNAATLWTWFMMMKSGYAVKVGYRADNVFLLLPVNGQIYNRPQMHLGGQRYYLMIEESGGGSLRTYEGQHEKADRVLQLDEAALPNVKGSAKSRTASFSFDDERYKIEFSYDSAVLEYLRAYPNVELSVLFRSGVSPVAEKSLTEKLGPHVEDRSPREALTFLLRFVQFATKYRRDRDNFGEERYLFPEESLAENASDCEDRAVLYAYLVRTLLDRRMVGLKWPTHVATAVRVGNGFEAASDDRTLTVDGDTYVMADPTYIGSSLGMEMPYVEGKEPEIIDFAQR